MGHYHKIRFKELSTWLKTFVIFGWIAIGLDVIAFLIGFVIGVLEALSV